VNFVGRTRSPELQNNIFIQEYEHIGALARIMGLQNFYCKTVQLATLKGYSVTLTLLALEAVKQALG
jgi:hypothetical protein